MTPTITSVGGGPSSLNAHAGTAFVQPFDQGSGCNTISISGTTTHAATSSAGEFLGFAHYDENNVFGGSGKLVIANLAGFEPNNNPVCSDLAPTFVILPTGGPGGRVMTPLGKRPRVVMGPRARATKQ